MQMAHIVNFARYTTNETLWMENSAKIRSLLSLRMEDSHFVMYSSIRMDGR